MCERPYLDQYYMSCAIYERWVVLRKLSTSFVDLLCDAVDGYKIHPITFSAHSQITNFVGIHVLLEVKRRRKERVFHYAFISALRAKISKNEGGWYGTKLKLLFSFSYSFTSHHQIAVNISLATMLWTFQPARPDMPDCQFCHSSSVRKMSLVSAVCLLRTEISTYY